MEKGKEKTFLSADDSWREDELTDTDGEQSEGESTASGDKAKVTGVKRWVVDLDQPPEERWKEVILYYQNELVAVSQLVRSEIAEMVGKKKATFIEKVVSAFMAGVAHAGAVFYGKELTGIAKTSGLPLGMLVLMQLVYEASAACTSIVVPQDPTKDSTPQHIRTMDWGMEWLRPLTIEVDFRRGGETQYVATTWVGYVGILTGMRPYGYSVSVNFRVTSGAYWKNIKKAILRAWPIGFLVREVLESESNFKRAVGALSLSELIAPVYFTVCGTQPNEGTLLTRDRECDTNRWLLQEHGPIVQTNIDHWSDNEDDDILWSIERRALARASIHSMSNGPIDEEDLWRLLSTRPILNSLTLSGTYMVPAKGILRTRLPQNQSRGFKPTDDPLPEGGEKRLECSKCASPFLASLNPKQACAHVGQWHSTFSDCSYLKAWLSHDVVLTANFAQTSADWASKHQSAISTGPAALRLNGNLNAPRVERMSRRNCRSH